MVHLIFCLRRLPHLSRAEFQRYWRETHAPLVKQHAGALGIKRYVQAHTIDPAMSQAIAAVRGAPEPFDGVAELWFDWNDVVSRMTTAAAAQAGRLLLEDERRFIDLPNSPIFFADDHVVIDG
ncbi:MAG TPA: EthD domain-containing protein [Candidatus Acidoferrales bacterium]|nr:EthD domain-containing protein [Candidatus Acidoferrales bacterium]